jgi:hypothetical protein
MHSTARYTSDVIYHFLYAVDVIKKSEKRHLQINRIWKTPRTLDLGENSGDGRYIATGLSVCTSAFFFIFTANAILGRKSPSAQVEANIFLTANNVMSKITGLVCWMDSKLKLGCLTLVPVKCYKFVGSTIVLPVR